MGNIIPGLGRGRSERDEPSPFPPDGIRSIQRFCPGVIWDFGLSRVAGGEMGREERQTEHSLWMPRAGTPCTLRSSSLGLCPPGVNKSRDNSHTGVSWINKRLGETWLWGTRWKSPAQLGIGELNSPAWLGCAWPLISAWGWMFARPDPGAGAAARVDTGL